MRAARILAALAVAAWPVAEARGGIIDVTAAFDSVSAAFFPEFTGSATHETYVLESGPPAELTGTLDSGQQLRVTFSAPAGQQINILPRPATADTFSIRLGVWADPAIIAPFIEEPGASYGFTGFTGAVPTVSSFLFTTDAADHLTANLLLSAGGFSFESLEMVFNVPAGYDRTFTGHQMGAVIGIRATWGPGSFPSNPGPLATITRAAASIPEPSMLLLAGAAMAGTAFRRRQSGTTTGIGIVSAWRRRRARTTPST